MRLRKLVVIATAVAGLAVPATAVVAAAGPASAAIHPGEVCDGSIFTNGLCMNATAGYHIGNSVQMWNSGVANDGFVLYTNHRCNAAGTVTSTCPFRVGSGENNKWLGHYVVQVYGGGVCVADANTNGGGDQGTCNNSCSGFGGSTGSLQVVAGFVSGQGYQLLNVYWSGAASADRYVQSPNAVGQALVLDDPGSAGETAWSYDLYNGC